MIIDTVGGGIELIYPRQLSNLIRVNRIHQTVVEYDILSTPQLVSSSTNIPTTDFTYNREIKTIDFFANKQDFILRSFIKDMVNLPIIDHSNDNNSFEISLSDGIFECLNNFGNPTQALLIDDYLVVGEFDNPSNILFKEFSTNHGVLITHMPNRFTIIKLSKSCQYIAKKSEYKGYTSVFTIRDTLKRLEL